MRGQRHSGAIVNEPRFGILIAALVVAFAISVVARVRSTRTAVDFQLAGQRMGVITNAFAICGDYVSAASFLGVAAAVYAAGVDGAWYATGFAAGFIPVLLFVATPLRRFGDRSIPDFLARRFNSEKVRIVSVVMVQLVILAYLVPQAVGGGLAWELFSDLALPGLTPYSTGIVASTLLTSSLVVIGGMRGTTWNQAIQFLVLLGILMWVAVALYADGFDYSDSVAAASAEPLRSVVESSTGEVSTESTVNQIGGGAARFSAPGARYSRSGQFALLATLMFGTAGLPHVMNRFFTSSTGRAARKTTVWVIGLIGLFYALAVMVGTAARFVIARDVAEHEWLADISVEGVLRTPEHALLALGRLYGGEMGLSIVTTGALLAIMSTIGGLLLAASASWGHDVYEQHLNPRASRTQALRAGQLVVAVIALAAALIAMAVDSNRIPASVPSVVASLVTTAFALAGCALTPSIVLAIWWKKVTPTAIIVGMVFGSTSAIACISYSLWVSASDLLQAPTIFLAPMVFVVIAVVSAFTEPAPDVDQIWVRMHGSANDRKAERLARITLETTRR